MKKQRKQVFLIGLGILFVLLHVIFVADSLETEFQLNAEWMVNIQNTASSSNPPPDMSRLLPFKLGQTVGYVTPEGALYNVTAVPYRAAISPYFYAAFPQNAQNTPFFASDGRPRGVLPLAGFPHFDEDRIYVFYPGGNSFAVCDSTGAPLWSHEGYATILTFASSRSGSAVGLVDGTILVHAPDGTRITTITPGGSVYPVILGADISGSGEYVASISGLQHQRFVLTAISGGTNTVVYHEYFEKDSNEPGLVQFSADDTMVYFAQQEKLTVLDRLTGIPTVMSVQGKILSIVESPATNLVFALSRLDSGYQVYLIENYNMLVGSFSFTAQHACIRVFENALYIGKDNSMSKLVISRK
ncbi:MAG: hypothetical protein LBS64_03365 [Spirochaetaceae bacterium]|jgi:hypothetical protein|nr:hypothetical protein [Spirochaetaceae bacterium]